MTRAFDVFGNIAIVNFPTRFKQKDKTKIAQQILKSNKAIRTVLEKVGKVKGRLRKTVTKYLAGEKTKEVLYRENNCVFRLNVDETYFSPRLSNERREIASEIKKGENVLVMFAGVGPFSIVIAKNSKADKVFSNEINRKANKYAEMNIELNKLKNKVVLVPGDVRGIVNLLQKSPRTAPTPQPCPTPAPKFVNNSKKSRATLERAIPKFDVIVMPRPQLKETFLKEAFALSKKGTRIYYYDFCKENETDFIVEKIEKEARQFRRRVKILKVKRAGEIAPYKIRVRVDFKIL